MFAGQPNFYFTYFKEKKHGITSILISTVNPVKPHMNYCLVTSSLSPLTLKFLSLSVTMLFRAPMSTKTRLRRVKGAYTNQVNWLLTHGGDADWV